MLVENFGLKLRLIKYSEIDSVSKDFIIDGFHASNCYELKTLNLKLKTLTDEQ